VRTRLRSPCFREKSREKHEIRGAGVGRNSTARFLGRKPSLLLEEQNMNTRSALVRLFDIARRTKIQSLGAFRDWTYEVPLATPPASIAISLRIFNFAAKYPSVRDDLSTAGQLAFTSAAETSRPGFQ